MPPISTTTMSKPLLLVLLLLPLSDLAAAPDPTPTDLLSPSDASSLLSFKSKADLDNKLYFVLNEHFDYCQWRGVKCAQGRVVRLLLPSFALRGVFPPDSLSRLDQLRVLSLRNNSLSGPLPDLSSLFNLKSLYLDGNHFSGAFPPSLLLLHRLTTLDLSRNNFSGPIPAGLARLARLSLLRLEFNQFNGTLPPLNQSFLLIFNVSGNNLSGAIPVTPSLLRFGATAFSLNPNLCGEIIKKACTSRAPFFNGDSSASAPYGQSAEAKGGHGGAIVVLSPKSSRNHHRNTGVVLGSTVGVAILVASVFLAVATVKRRSSPTEQPESKPPTVETVDISRANSRVEPQNEESEAQKPPRKSGSLVFCSGESGVYNLEQLMRASAELLGRGLMGTTYKAVLDNELIVTVKRLDAGKTAATSGQVFEQHMEIVGGLRHPNLVPIRAFFQAKGERLVIFDYQPNGSLFKLIHGSRSARAKPLHWTSCLKIAEDVAQGLAYIHQASKLPHGNLKSSNVLLGADFEARLTDYCLAILADDVSSFVDDPDSAGYRAPESRKSNRKATPKSDIYAFGVLLLELLTGKHASQHPVVAPHDMRDWVRAMRAADDGGEHHQLEMLTEVATVCRLTSPEQRPTMWQVLKMIQEIKDSAVAEDSGSAAEY